MVTGKQMWKSMKGAATGFALQRLLGWWVLCTLTNEDKELVGLFGRTTVWTNGEEWKELLGHKAREHKWHPEDARLLLSAIAANIDPEAKRILGLRVNVNEPLTVEGAVEAPVPEVSST